MRRTGVELSGRALGPGLFLSTAVKNKKKQERKVDGRAKCDSMS
jgi:hypothetical protein